MAMDTSLAANFVTQAVAKAVQRARELGELATDVVEVRAKGYREWDPEVIRIDKELESLYVRSLQETGLRIVVLSEELQRLEISGGGEQIYAVCDPFDGSALYRRRIRAFWFTALAFYDGAGSPLGSCRRRHHCR
jgi:fructose-1,6-bisphosphatase/inositol monophosphatase family enzyme